MLSTSLRGLAPAREKGRLLAWDENDWIYLLNYSGEIQGQIHTPGKLVAAACADDGSAFAAVGTQGEIWWLAPDLMTTWRHTMPERTVAAALDPFGHYLAVADAGGRLHLYDRNGGSIFQIQTPRPLHHLGFVPASPFLLGAADFGLVGCLDMAGHWVWREGLVAHIGALSCSGDGAAIVLACYTEGLQRFSLAGKKLAPWQIGEASRLVSQSFDDQRLLAAGLGERLYQLDAEGRTLSTLDLDQPPVAITVSALGTGAAVASANGRITFLEISPV
ncbi:MAG TPA: hypothetical protein VGY77_09290 [Gemmataceae bacterium]|nr:hypothetical protein [Gemmataceae bacterium]